MKPLSLKFLNDAISQNPLLYRDDIIDLYKMYTGIEIDDYNKIIDSTNEFFDYLTSTKAFQNSKQMQTATRAAQNVILPKMMKFNRDTFETKFAESVLELSPTKIENSHILDVGPGDVPYSALAMGTQAKKVSAMDKDFLFAIESLKSMNVDAFDMYFDENTPVDKYDFVVGRCPCSAIPHIVKQCKEANKPYFLELCNCALPNRTSFLRDEHFRETYSWKNVLPDIDPNIKFVDNYAFNLDASPEQVKKLIDRIHESITPSKKFEVPAKKIFLPTDAVVSTSTPQKKEPTSYVDNDTFWYMD